MRAYTRIGRSSGVSFGPIGTAMYLFLWLGLRATIIVAIAVGIVLFVVVVIVWALVSVIVAAFKTGSFKENYQQSTSKVTNAKAVFKKAAQVKPGVPNAPPQLVKDQGFFLPLQDHVDALEDELESATTPTDRFAAAVLIQNLQQMELSALEELLEAAPDRAYLRWSSAWSSAARADLKRLDQAKQDALTDMSKEDAGEALTHAQQRFLTIQDELRHLPAFSEVVDRFAEHVGRAP
jgi:hypothetical protein